MTTRIFLHGGNTSRVGDGNGRFFKKVLDSANKDTVKIVCVYFARPEHRWEDSYEEDQYALRRISQELGKELETTLASYDIDDFIEKINESDVIFINGGMKGHLKETLLSIGVERFRELLNGKILVGISAGANILSKYYYSVVAQDIREGIGLLNIKLLTHYSDESVEQLQRLAAYGEKLQIVTIPEEQFVVIEQ